MSKFFHRYIWLPLVLAVLCGCSQSKGIDSSAQQTRIRFMVAPYASFGTGDGVVLSTVRIIAVDKSGRIAYNHSTENGLSAKPGMDNTFEIELPEGSYSIYTIANETTAMGTALDAAGSENDLKNIEVKGSFSEETVPLVQNEQIVLRQQNGQTQVSADGGGSWQDKFTTQLVRTQSKVTLHMRKKVGSADVVVIKKVEVCNLPDRCYLLQKSYMPAQGDLQTITPYDDATGIRFDTDIDNETSRDNYTPVVTTGNIFPERWTDGPTSDTDAAYLKIYAEYNGLNTVYTIGLHGDSENGYNLARNVNHIVYATITGTGDLDANRVFIESKWWTEEVSGDIEAPYLNVSEIKVPMVFSPQNDGTMSVMATRIFFWSNLAGSEIAMGDKIETETGIAYDMAGYLPTEIHITKSNPVAGGGYDTAGYIELTPSAQLNWLAFNDEASTYEFILKAGKLTRKLTLERVDYLTPTKFSEIPWIGIYYSALQKGERIISAKNDGAWTATTEYPSGTSEFVLMDPSLSTDTHIYTDTPTDAEMFPITSGEQTLSGDGRIYFRVGLTDTSTTPRAARIKLETTSGTYYIYVRQGQYDYVMRNTDPAGTIGSDGLLGSTTPRTSSEVKSISQIPLTYTSSIAGGGSSLTDQYEHSTYYKNSLNSSDFPTKTTQLFCWNRYNGSLSGNYYYSYSFHQTNPWTGPITPYPYKSTITPTSSYNTAIYRDGCPTGYRQPTVNQLRYSLFKNIPQKAADGNYAMAANPEDRNYQWGYYADGFFDRRIPRSVESNTGSTTVTTPPCTVGSDLSTAYWGILFYNPETYISLFLPASGYRDAANGELRMPGLGGFLWTQDSASSTSKSGLTFSYIDGNLDCRIVNGIHPARAASFRCVVQ